MTASAGETSIPAPVTVSVTDVDVALMWRAVQGQRRGVSNPWTFWAGVAVVAMNVPFIFHGNAVGAWCELGSGALLIISSLIKDGKAGDTLRATHLSFDHDGLTVDVASSPASRRRYEWCKIQRIDDVGDSFVIVSRLDICIVVPKRAFADHGHEAWAFFTAHGVAGRVPPPSAGLAASPALR